MMPDGAMPVNNVASNALLNQCRIGLEYFVTDYIGLELALDNNYL